MKGDDDHVDSLAINVLSICSGYGGLDLGLDLATGGAARAVCYVEREAFAAAILARRMEEEALAPAPVWSDLRTFDGRAWRGVVDCITGGYPCQPFSHAGRRLGEQDARHLWPDIARIIGEVEPGIVFFENVAGHLTLGFDAVRANLERLGYRVAAGLFSAAEVGASHRRERLFILGVAHSCIEGARNICEPCRRQDRTAVLRQDNESACSDGIDATSANVADSDRKRRSFAPSSQVRGSNADGYGETLADRDGGRCKIVGLGGLRPDGDAPRRHDADRCDGTDATVADAMHDHGRSGISKQAHGTERHCNRRGPSIGHDELADSMFERRERSNQEDQGSQHAQGRRGQLDAFPPGPSDTIAWKRILADRPDLAPATQRELRGVVDGSASRLDRLRALGNGVVPLVAAYAFTSLWACLEQE